MGPSLKTSKSQHLQFSLLLLNIDTHKLIPTQNRKCDLNDQSMIPFPSSFNKSDPDIQFLVSPGVSWMMTKHEPWISSKYIQWSYSWHMKLCVRRILDFSTRTEINFTRTLLFTSPWEGFLIMCPDLNSVLMDYFRVSQRPLDKLFSRQENFHW